MNDCSKDGVVLPGNVKKQIEIWEEDKNSLNDTDVVVLSEFATGEIEKFKEALEKEEIEIVWESAGAVAVSLQHEMKVNEILLKEQ